MKVLFFHELDEQVLRQGLAVEETLHEIAAIAAQEFQLLTRLHAFRYRFLAKLLKNTTDFIFSTL